MTDDRGADQPFPLVQCWREPFEQLARALREIVTTKELSGITFFRTARLIHAIEQLPLTPNVSMIEASLTNEQEGGRSWLSISVSLDSLSLTRGSSSYEIQGTESVINSVLEAEVEVGNNRESDDPIAVMIELQDWVTEWRSMATDPDCLFDIHDEDMDNSDTRSAWESLPDGV